MIRGGENNFHADSLEPSNCLLLQIPVPWMLIFPVPPTPAASLSTPLERASAFSLASWTMEGVERTRCVPTPSGEDATPPDSQDSVRLTQDVRTCLTQDVRTCLVSCSEWQTAHSQHKAVTSLQPQIHYREDLLTSTLYLFIKSLTQLSESIHAHSSSWDFQHYPTCS